MTTGSMLLEATDLTIEFGDLVAVDGVSFEVERGRSFGLIGESGCGKSTVLRAIALDGRELGHRRDRAFFKRVQMVFQDPYGSLHPRKMVNDVLRGPLVIHKLGRVQARIDEALAAVGLDPSFRFRFPHQLSGGQRQRVAIARCLVLEPEPTSALDVSVQAEVLNLLNRLRRERGLTYVMVSHDLAVVAHMCERIAVMNLGRIVEELTTAELRAGRASQPYTRTLLAASMGEVAIAEADA